MKPLLLFGLLLSTFALSQTPDPTPADGRITGSVVDGDGKAVSDATVYVVQESLLSITDAYPIQTKADSHGHFDFGQRLKHGVYDIYAKKEQDGYPDPTSAFYRALDFQPQTVQLIGAQPEENVEIKLGEKAGVVKGKVTNGDTGMPLEAAIHLSKLAPDDGQPTMQGKSGTIVNGKFRELVPANTDIYVLVEVKSIDFRDWTQFHEKLHLQPAENRNLDIRLYKSGPP